MQRSIIPDEVLQIAEAIKAKRIDHREYARVRSELQTHATFASPGSVILVVGPSRVGKTRVARGVRKDLSRSAEHDRFPVVSTEAVNHDRGHYSGKHLALRLLKELQHPLFADADPNWADASAYRARLRLTEPTLRLALEKALDARGVRWIFIDEAHHIVRTSSQRAAAQNLDSLKSLGNTTEVVSIWIAGYELLEHGFASPHLNGRMRIIEFPRYRNNERDLSEFADALEVLSRELPLRAGTSLNDFSAAIYEGTLGAIGAVMAWAESALVKMVCSNQRFLALEHFQASRYEAQLSGLRAEIQRGEALLKRVDVRPDEAVDAAWHGASGRTQRKAHKPFQRKAKRDPIK